MDIFQKFMLGAMAFFLLMSFLSYFIFLRPMPVLHATAKIEAKTHKPAGSYWQQQVGVNRGFRTAVEIPVAESYVLELYCKDLDVRGHIGVEPSEHENYEIGDSVVMSYQQRGMPVFGYKTMVLEIEPDANMQ